MKSKKEDVSKFIASCYDIKPNNLFMGELKWKYLVRSALRGKNIIIIGSTGQGKTFAVKCVVDALAVKCEENIVDERELSELKADPTIEIVSIKKNEVKYNRARPLYVINLGACQDPRASLIGNTHFSKDTGTFFTSSPFVEAITTPNAIVLLDEISRAGPDASNILMTVLDPIQRYLRLDEKDGSVVKVAEGVTFIATANIGNEYTATRVMDKALLNRFPVKIEMDIPSQSEEMELVRQHVPDADMDIMENVTHISETTRIFAKEGKISNFISTRAVIEMAELTQDGFNLVEMADIIIYPDYPDDGGVDSERTMVKQVVQKYVSVGATSKLTPSSTSAPGLPPF